MGFRLNHSHPPPQDPDQPQLKGVSHLVNPPEDAPEIVSPEEDEGERDYVERFLRFADQALRHVKQGFLHRHKRTRIH